jgi:hypothetical protein
MLFNTKLTLPVDLTNGNFDIIKDSSLLIYYKFDKDLFKPVDANSTIFNLPSQAQNFNNLFGPTLQVLG